MKTFEIWVEGYRVSCEFGNAELLGTGIGMTFDDAVNDYMSKNPNCGIERNTVSRYISEESYQNRRSNWNIWACNLFDNEQDARQSFG